ncbi:MAG: hypothetical protein ACTSYH_07710, partial [Candidatus Heimdallarchaeaceae archaeon]
TTTTTVPTCSDGTPYNECSMFKPKYCDNMGVLHENYCYGPDEQVGTADDCGCFSGYECQADGSCKLVSENKKDLTKYTDGEVFLISDKYSTSVLPLIPVTTWTEENGEVIKYPTLIYHDEGTGHFDADSILYFLEQYHAKKVTAIGNIPSELTGLINSLGLTPEIISVNDYFSYWKSYEDIILVEANDSLELIASTYASLRNVPLVIGGRASPNVFDNKNVILIGNVPCPSNAKSCNERYTCLEDIEKEYVRRTNTNKIILVNPNDLNIKVTETFTPEKSSKSISELYGKTSLAAPILASAKHEVIISTTSTDYEEIDDFIKDKVISLFNLPEEVDKILGKEVLDLDEMEVTYYEQKDENGFTVSYHLLKEKPTDDTTIYLQDRGTYSPYVSESCAGKNITIVSDKGEYNYSIGSYDSGRGIYPGYISITPRFPASLIPDGKENFNLTLKTDGCGTIMYPIDGELYLTLDLLGENKLAEVTSVANKKEVSKNIFGLERYHEIEIKDIPVDDRFLHEFSIPWCTEITKEEYHDGKLDLSLRGRIVTDFCMFDHITIKPKLKNTYLTIIASPLAVQLCTEIGEYMNTGYYFRDNLDQRRYSHIYENGLIDCKTGRIMGITISDVSSYIARDLFYDNLAVNKHALIMVKSCDEKYPAEGLKKGFEEIWTEDMKARFDSYTECYGYNDEEMGCDTHASEMRSVYNSSELVFFANHGATTLMDGIITSNDLSYRYLSPSVQIADACLTCSFDDAWKKGKLFCTQNLRRGSLGYIGANSVAIGHTKWSGDMETAPIKTAIDNRRFIPYLFKDGKDLGTAYRDIYSGGSQFYYILGDPTFKIRS